MSGESTTGGAGGTDYRVSQDPMVLGEQVGANEILDQAELDAIVICAENIASIILVAANGQAWHDGAQDGANRAETAAVEAAASQASAASSASAAAVDAAQAGSAASAAAGSATAAQGYATSAGNSATSAANSLASMNSNPRLLPSGGVADAVLKKVDGSDYNVTWGPGGSGGGTLDGLTDVDTAGAVAKDFLGLNDAGTLWIPRKQAVLTNLDSLSDVAIASPAEGHGIFFDQASGLFKNKIPQAASSAILKYPDIRGPVTVQYSADMANKFGRIFCTNGPVTFNFDDDIAMPVGQVLQSLFRIYDADVNPVTLVGNPVTGPKAVKDPVVVTNRGSGVLGTAITNATNTARTWTCPIGDDKAVVFVYVANAANTANPSDSPGIELDGEILPWDNSAQAAVTAPRIFVKQYYLGDIDTPTDFTYRPAWVDYGGHGNVNSFFFGIFSARGVDSFEPVHGLVPKQNTTQVQTITLSRAIAAGEINRDLEYFFVRRSNSNNLLINCTGATVQSSGQTGSATNQAEMRHVAATEAAVPDTTTACQMEWTGAGSYGAVSCDVNWMWRPKPDNMRLQTPNRVSQLINKDGTTLGIVYDSNDRVVELDF